jgi:basic membrane protein A
MRMDEQTTAKVASERTRMSWTRTFALTLVVGVAVVAIAGCGKRGGTTGGDSGSDGGNSGGGPSVGLVTDVGGLNDRSFNALANKGMEQAEKELGATGTVLESKSGADYAKNLGQFAQQKTGLTIGVGFLMGEPVKAVAEKAAESKFAIVDYSVTEIGNPKNVRGLVFHEEQAGYLAGYLAGLVEQDGKLKGLNPKKTVSAVGGQKIPAVEKYIAGYQAGVKKACSACNVLIDYSQDFVDQSKCQDRALAQISKGSDIVFQVAGGCGQGALDAAKTKGVWGIGVDADQAYLGSHILTSATKNTDHAVFETIKAVKDGTFEGGQDGVYGLAEDGVGLGEIAPAATSYKAKVDAIAEQIKAGKVDIPTTLK